MSHELFANITHTASHVQTPGSVVLLSNLSKTGHNSGKTFVLTAWWLTANHRLESIHRKSGFVLAVILTLNSCHLNM